MVGGTVKAKPLVVDCEPKRLDQIALPLDLNPLIDLVFVPLSWALLFFTR